ELMGAPRRSLSGAGFFAFWHPGSRRARRFPRKEVDSCNSKWLDRTAASLALRFSVSFQPRLSVTRSLSERTQTMLVLSRSIGERIRIGPDIVITVVRLDRGKVGLGIDAPKWLPINREEIYDRLAKLGVEIVGREPLPIGIGDASTPAA